jgi:hypothetical protein
VDGVGNTDFANAVPADPSGNSIGPFANGQTVNLRTRVRNTNGASTSAVRTLQIAQSAGRCARATDREAIGGARQGAARSVQARTARGGVMANMRRTCHIHYTQPRSPA